MTKYNYLYMLIIKQNRYQHKKLAACAIWAGHLTSF